ncbi:coiled-coil domain-containing protein 93-like isoform X2 [Tubulanus polymorphus]|uniref:coiled-coil domain-containing protein 93-like isoform X2 n=1 Tax=Tubulanus polymorphus TaxID=672921 RepID=UPI003DA5C0B9
MSAAGVLTPRRRASSKMTMNTVYDADGNLIQAESREDEEQGEKLAAIVELLLAAGYFRARIKGLSPFDKVVGGMTWCITTCNFDVDVDLLFQENLTIGQKIALTEKIVVVLPRMKCPHRIEPHQIQGLDFIHIFPVIQWLVKKAIATKEETGDYIRAFSISQFHKSHSMPEDDAYNETKAAATDAMNVIKEVYKPTRKYKRQDADKISNESIRVQSTLLEYGRRYGIGSEALKANEEAASKKKTATDSEQAEPSIEELRAEEEKRINMLMKNMSAAKHEGKLTASAVGTLVGLQSEEIQQIASEYAEKHAELGSTERDASLGSVQQHKRAVQSLTKQIQQQTSKSEGITSQHEKLQEIYNKTQRELEEAEKYSQRIDDEMDKLIEMEAGENQVILQQLRSLVELNESLKRQELEFKAHCKDEMSRLQATIDQLKLDSDEGTTDDQERSKMIDKQYNADKEKLHKIRLLLARKNREISGLQRKIDEVPSRAELSQYQRRFIELYNQVASTHKETKQFYTLYNTLDDTKLYLNKEVNLLNSIHDNFEQAMSSAASKEQFLKQFEQIVEGIKQNRLKVEKKKQEEKMRRDGVNDEYLDLIEKQRLYFKSIKEFKEECRKNEIMLAQLRQ